MNTPNSLLDYIITNDGSTKTGVVDYTNKKFVHFYDLTNKNDPNIVILVMIWKIYHPETRFSIFISKHFPQYDLPEVVLMNRKSIKESNIKFRAVKENIGKKKFLVKK